MKFKDHPTRKPERGKLSPFTIRKDIKILKGFGTWLDREGFDNSFTDLPVPKEPKRLVKVLTDDEIDQIIGSINPHTDIYRHRLALVLDGDLHAQLLPAGQRDGKGAAVRS